MKPEVWAVIPARFGSTRFPGKPLAKIAGRELIRWVIEGTRQAKLISRVVVATDDARIADVVRAEGADAIMTDSDLPSGTDRIWAAVKNSAAQVVINVQGDEPLTNGDLVDSLVAPMLADTKLEMATLAHPLSQAELDSPNAVKVIVNQASDAIYFSRFAIPYSRQKPEALISGAMKHIGMYAYRTEFLARFCAAPVAELERAESLEQLRALYLGARIRVIATEQRAWGVDTPEDVFTIEKLLAQRSLTRNHGGSHGNN
jgi:3-deoxy-manno-octulosonate cytidylyltransferase (CMP-KDO synthetase)